MRRNCIPYRKQQGVSLIEVLITTVVFSIGVLGISGLGAFAKRATFESVQRSAAAELAYTLLEEMRSNKAALETYLAAGTLGRGSLGAEPAPDCDAPGVNCTAVEFATHSLWMWEQVLDTGMETAGGNGTGGLVSPTACITGPAGAVAGTYVVTIVWRDVTEISNPGFNNCGTGTGLYGPNNAFRRLAVVQSFIDPTI
ncbi:MAG: type IV pilus modification protein PilV [Gammaproteobacteria bacterium]|nr:type IV pilus modification protein PilV [Gammaproteobacteria bacterium]